MQGEGRSKEGQRPVLLTASQNKVTTSMAASGQLFRLSTYILHETHSKPEDPLHFRGLSWNKLEDFLQMIYSGRNTVSTKIYSHTM